MNALSSTHSTRLIVTLLAACVPAAAAADAVTDWNAQACELVAEAKLGPPPAMRVMAAPAGAEACESDSPFSATRAARTQKRARRVGSESLSAGRTLIATAPEPEYGPHGWGRHPEQATTVVGRSGLPHPEG